MVISKHPKGFSLFTVFGLPKLLSEPNSLLPPKASIPCSCTWRRSKQLLWQWYARAFLPWEIILVDQWSVTFICPLAHQFISFIPFGTPKSFQINKEQAFSKYLEIYLCTNVDIEFCFFTKAEVFNRA